MNKYISSRISDEGVLFVTGEFSLSDGSVIQIERPIEPLESSDDVQTALDNIESEQENKIQIIATAEIIKAQLDGVDAPADAQARIDASKSKLGGKI